jgi:hypothetical protein
VSDLFNKILGIGGNEKRIYHLDKDQLTAEEFEQGKVISEIIWGEDGLVMALGPTWNLVHDPRFMKIEDAFIIERDAVFGGDAASGRQYITYHSQFQLSSIAELEQYSEILGEGRYFRQQIVKDGLDPQTFHLQSEDVMWRYVRSECPNYFTRDGNPNKEAQRLIKLFKLELLSLIDDYAEVAYCKEWLNLETGDLADASAEFSVFAEVDFLERALTLRASLRSTALKILKANGGSLMKILDKVELTDYESDQVLKAIYSTEYAKLYTIPSVISSMVSKFMSDRLEDRRIQQSSQLKSQSQDLCKKLLNGEMEYLKPEVHLVEVPESEEEKMIRQLIDDPIKYEAFMMLTEAEKIGDDFTASRLKAALFENSEPLDSESMIRIKQETIGARTANSIKSITHISE